MGSSLGSYKLNTGGVSIENRGLSWYGGILRDDRGCWVRGFMGHLGIGLNRIDAELWAIFKGVELVDGLRLQNIILETDTLIAFNILEQPDLFTKSSVLKALVSDCQKLIKKNGITLNCICPEENKCADFLAKLAVDDEDEYTDVLDPPPGIESLLMVDDGNDVHD